MKTHLLQSKSFNSVGRNISALVGCIKKLRALYKVQLLETYKITHTIQRMTIPRLTKWRTDFDILMIQRLFFWKKGQKFVPTPHGFHLRTFPTPHGCQKVLKLPLTGFFYPWRELIFSLKKLFLTPNWLQIGKNGLNWPSFFYVT